MIARRFEGAVDVAVAERRHARDLGGTGDVYLLPQSDPERGKTHTAALSCSFLCRYEDMSSDQVALGIVAVVNREWHWRRVSEFTS